MLLPSAACGISLTRSTWQKVDAHRQADGLTMCQARHVGVVVEGLIKELTILFYITDSPIDSIGDNIGHMILGNHIGSSIGSHTATSRCRHLCYKWVLV